MNEKEIEKIRKRFDRFYWERTRDCSELWNYMEEQIEEAYELGRATGHLEASAENSFMADGTMEAL